MPRRLLATCIALALIGATAPPAAAAAPPPTWDGLSLVKAKKVQAVYLLPGADFRGYSKVMIDPTEVAFKKDWVRDYNSRAVSSRISDADAKKMLEAARTGIEGIFRQAYADAGYQVVTEPGADVLQDGIYLECRPDGVVSMHASVEVSVSQTVRARIDFASVGEASFELLRRIGDPAYLPVLPK